MFIINQWDSVKHSYFFLFLPRRQIKFSGMAGVVGGLSVAFKQLIPDQRIDIRFRQLRVHVRQRFYFSSLLFINFFTVKLLLIKIFSSLLFIIFFMVKLLLIKIFSSLLFINFFTVKLLLNQNLIHASRQDRHNVRYLFQRQI